MKRMTLYDFCTELQTWCTFTPEELEKAKASKVTTLNNGNFRDDVQSYIVGEYDEDINLLGDRIKGYIQ